MEIHIYTYACKLLSHLVAEKVYSTIFHITVIGDCDPNRND